MDAKKVSYAALSLAAVVAVGGIVGVDNPQQAVQLANNTQTERSFAGTASQNFRGQIIGRVFEDTDVNGIRTSTDTSISGVTVELFAEEESILTTTTNAQGAFAFEGVQAGEYLVKLIPNTGKLKNLFPTRAGKTSDDPKTASVGDTMAKVQVLPESPISHIMFGFAKSQ